jgi:hypothetical protein
LAMPKPMGAIVSLLQDDWLVTKYIPFLLWWRTISPAK